ncbi:MAG: putative lipoprotein [Proteobacteria bacterium]|nr:putative lipoprotein [Pseudomonadota bacterium]
MIRISVLALILTLLAGCGGDGSSSSTTAPLAADNVNLIFVVSPDLADHAPGDIQADTANLTSQGLQRSLLLATYLQQQVLGAKNVTAIYALSPMTHLQTANKYPDMSPLATIQPFALLNQITLPVSASGATYTANSYPINAAYASGSLPSGVAAPTAGQYCPDCAGLDFNNTEHNNDTLVSGIIAKNKPGFYVFSAPWKTISNLLAYINSHHGYQLNLPAAYTGPDQIYAISIPPSGSASLVTYYSNLTPPATYPVLPSPVASASCPNPMQAAVSTSTAGVTGVINPANINTNQTLYIVRHAEAHPDPGYNFEDGNYVGAGQWRALSLANTLRGKISPKQVYSIDPAQWYSTGAINVSYVRPSLTILPYAVANNLPYSLVSSFPLGTNPVDPGVAKSTSDFFFTGGKFSNQTVLLAWESGHIRPLINALLASYGNNVPLLPTAGPPSGGWPHADYDTVWTVRLDAQGNATVDNALCEGIDSTLLPIAAPQF